MSILVSVWAAAGWARESRGSEKPQLGYVGSRYVRSRYARNGLELKQGVERQRSRVPHGYPRML